MASKFFGQYLLEKGFLNKDQLLKVLDLQRDANPILGEIAIDLSYLTRTQANSINEKQKREDKRFGDIAQEMNLLNTEQIDELLVLQKKRRKFFGEIVVEQGFLSPNILERELTLHQQEKEEALNTLEVGLQDHADAKLVNSLLNTCRKLFQRILKTQCDFSELIPKEGHSKLLPLRSACIDVTTLPPFFVAIACEPGVAEEIAMRFLNVKKEMIDNDLAIDAVGETLNTIMGYVVKDVVVYEENYTASPPDFNQDISTLLSEKNSALVKMNAGFGQFYLISGRRK